MDAARMPRRISLILASTLAATTTLGACDDTSDSSSGAADEAREESDASAPEKTETSDEHPDQKASKPEPSDEDQAHSELDDEAFCNALSVVQSNCQACHGSELVAGAPMSLVTYEDFVKPAVSDPARKVYELVEERVRDQKRPMPPAGVLGSEKLAPLDAWLKAGAPETAAMCEPASEVKDATDVSWPEDCEDIYTIVAHDPDDESKPYIIPANSEVHPWFPVDAPWGDDEVQLLATRPITENPAAIHHWILWDAKERINLTFWAPGASGDSFPNDVGLFMPKGEGSLGLDMHYFNRNNDQPVEDRSGLELCVTHDKKRPKTAALSGLFGNANVPANTRVDNATSCVVSGEMHLIGIIPHMHRFGRHAHLEIQRGGTGPIEVLYDGAYNFEEQTIKPLEDTLIKEGDVLTTICTFENTSNKAVSFGEDTEDEMCINWIRYYPKGGFTCSRMAADGSTAADPDITGQADNAGESPADDLPATGSDTTDTTVGGDDEDAGVAPPPSE